jgi:hypothetical protein
MQQNTIASRKKKKKIDCKLEFITGNDKTRPGWIR